MAVPFLLGALEPDLPQGQPSALPPAAATAVLPHSLTLPGQLTVVVVPCLRRLVSSCEANCLPQEGGMQGASVAGPPAAHRPTAGTHCTTWLPPPHGDALDR